MSHRSRLQCGCMAALLAVSVTGCEAGDSEHLSAIAHKLEGKFETMTEGSGSKLNAGWQAFRGNFDEFALDLRVKARLRWEKSLADSDIVVTAQDKTVELKGTVKTLEQRRKAVELAESTTGVEKVNDSLESPKTE